jgi:hypothetical protein
MDIISTADDAFERPPAIVGGTVISASRLKAPLALTIGLVAAIAGAAEPKARISIDRAIRMAGELFPDICGTRGRMCTVAIDARANCPSEIFIVFPDELKSSPLPHVVWVALDERGQPIAIASRKQEICGNS